MRLRRKKWAGKMIEDNQSIALNLDSLENLPDADYLEIGSGRGLFLLEKALKDQEHFYLGIEINYNAFSLAIKRAQDERYKDLSNFAFLNAPFDKVFPFLKENRFKAIYLNFSDPWPKKRQFKRRLTYPTKLEQYYQLLVNDGKIFFKTDNELLFLSSNEYFKEFGKFQVLSSGIYEKNDSDDVVTEFEKKFRDQGLKIYRIVAKK